MKTTIIILTLFFSLKTFSANDDEFKGMYSCFNIHQIKLNINYERVHWPNSQLNDVCDVSFNIDSTTPTYFYYTRGWHDPSFCKKILEDWNKLKEDTNRKVCIAARLDPAEKRKIGEKEFLERSAPYEVIKSGKWCHSYFGGYCN